MEEQILKFLNKTFWVAAVLAAVLVLFLLSLMGYHQQYLDQQNQDQITVSGQGKVYVKPDVALVSLGVSSQETTVANVVKNNTQKMNAVIEAVKALGVEEKDIQTTNYSLNPVYNYEKSEMSYRSISSAGILAGYKLDQSVQVKIRDFTKVGEVISKATENGANVVGSLQFTIDDVEKFRNEARSEAIKQAKEKAEILSKESGVKLGKIINVYENYYPMYDTKTAMGGATLESAPAVPTIQPGQQEINITINLTYRVK